MRGSAQSMSRLALFPVRADVYCLIARSAFFSLSEAMAVVERVVRFVGFAGTMLWYLSWKI